MTTSDHHTTKLIIGIGNDQRGDDAIGLEIARRLRSGLPTATTVHEETGDGLSLLDTWDGFGEVVLIDAACSGSTPGTISRFDAIARAIPEGTLRGCSTHTMSMAAIIELARALGRLPPRLTVYAIEGRNFEIGATVTPEVQAAAREVELSLRREPVTPPSVAVN